MTDLRSVGEVAELVGVSVRTLHHYDEIGLVPPTARSGSGYRRYSEADIERLHHVLMYRELGFPLTQIASLIDGGRDRVEVLAHQRDLLRGRVADLHKKITALEDMMNDGTKLTAAQRARLFGTDWPSAELDAEAKERWGDTPEYRQSQRRVAAFTAEDWQRIKMESSALEADLAAAMTAGVEPGSGAANALAERHRAGIGVYYDCDHARQVSLAQMYLADERFTAHYERVAPGLTEYLVAVISANARA